MKTLLFGGSKRVIVLGLLFGGFVLIAAKYQALQTLSEPIKQFWNSLVNECRHNKDIPFSLWD